MKIDLSQTIFYLDLKHVHKYSSAQFQPNPLFTSQQMATEHAESVAEEKNKKHTHKKKSRQTHRGSRRDGMPQLLNANPNRTLPPLVIAATFDCHVDITTLEEVVLH